jgi:hypothetical protein
MSFLTNFNWLTKKILVYNTIHPYFFEFLLYIFKNKKPPAKRNCNNEEGFLFIFVLFPKKIYRWDLYLYFTKKYGFVNIYKASFLCCGVNFIFRLSTFFGQLLMINPLLAWQSRSAFSSSCPEASRS